MLEKIAIEFYSCKLISSKVLLSPKLSAKFIMFFFTKAHFFNIFKLSFSRDNECFDGSPGIQEKRQKIHFHNNYLFFCSLWIRRVR